MLSFKNHSNLANHEKSTITRSYGKFKTSELFKQASNKPTEVVKLITFMETFISNHWFDEEELPTLHNLLFHYSRIEQADLNYPIIVRKGTNDILDGIHRLAKAALSEHSTILVQYLDDDDLVLCRVEE